MKRKITLSIALALSLVFVSLMKSDSKANAAPPPRFVVSTGVVMPGSGQTLRVTVTPFSGTDTFTYLIGFKSMKYMAAGCSGMPAVCRHTVVSQDATPFQTLSNASQALSYDVQGTGDGVNVVVESNRRDVRVNAMIINIATGETVAYCDMTAEGGGWTS